MNFEQIVEQRNVHAMTGFQFRFHPTLQRMKELIIRRGHRNTGIVPGALG